MKAFENVENLQRENSKNMDHWKIVSSGSFKKLGPLIRAQNLIQGGGGFGVQNWNFKRYQVQITSYPRMYQTDTKV